MQMQNQNGFTCTDCKKTIKSEKVFLKHTCKEKIKRETMASPEGILGFTYYSYWLKIKNHGECSLETYLSSSYFNTFTKFAKFIKTYNVPRPYKYIDFMLRRKILPNLWTNSDIFSVYLNWHDSNSDPYEEAKKSIENIVVTCDELNIGYNEFFTKINMNHIVDMIQKRLLSPWLILNSGSFKNEIEKLSIDERIIIGKTIGFSYWFKQLNEKQDVCFYMKEICKDMGI